MMPEHFRLLVVEDHVALAQNLLDYFDDERYVLDFAQDGLTALHLVATNTYDMIILDIMLPGVSGYEICRRLREDLHCNTPVIMMTAKDQLQDKEAGFHSGADDYLVKPFHLKELKLRVDAMLRRTSGRQSQVINVGDVAFDPGTLRVTFAAQPPIQLTGNAARIFEVLIKAYPNFVSYENLHEKLWGEREVDVNVLRTHVYTLRKQLQDNFGVSMIKTLHGRGYALQPKGDQ
jgi:DNA-binding response OmpR family regulator